MKGNNGLSLALHTLSHMAGEPDRVRTSVDLADHAGTNPVVVRRVLGKLREARPLTPAKGHAGGWRLAKSAESITLADVYLAQDERLVSGGGNIEPSFYSVETGLQTRVAEVLDDIEANLVERLRETKITDVHPNSCSCCSS